MPHTTTWFAMALTASLLTACGPAKSTAAGGVAAPVAAPPAPQALDACSLLPAAQVEAATGVKVGAVKAVTPAASETGRCEYQHADTQAFGASIVIAVSAYKPENVEAQKRVWTTFMKSTPIAGVGDFAYYNEAGGTIMAGRGDHAITLQMLDGPAGAGPRLAAIKSLAGAALARL
jgi:hypothetical protein